MIRNLTSFMNIALTNRLAAMCLCTLTWMALTAMPAEAVIIYPANNGFEVPNKGNSFQYNPPGASWTFVGGTGVAANSSGFNVVGATNGNSDSTTSTNGQAGFIQGGNGTTSGGSYFFQAINLSSFTYGGTLTVSWADEHRTSQLHDYKVLLRNTTLNSDTLLGTYTAASGSAFNPRTSPSASFQPGNNYALYFVGINTLGGDKTSFIDNVSLNITPYIPAPEPSSLMLLGMGVLGLSARRRRRSESQVERSL